MAAFLSCSCKPTVCALSCAPSLPSLASRSSGFVSPSCFSQGSVEPLTVQNQGTLFTSVECSSRPKKKCTAHHNKTRPKKHNPYDKNRKPPVYPKPPPAPPIITLGWGDEVDDSPSATPSTPEPALVEA